MLGTLLEMQQRRPTQPQAKYTCRYCHNVFVIESRYMAHKCKQMKREEEFQSPIGQTAWHYYTLWMREQKRMPPRDGASFMASKFFRTFITFVEFARKVNLPRPEKFIWFMVQKTFAPTMWTSNEVYTLYLEFLDRRVPPMEQAQMSIKSLFQFADKHEIDVSEVFTKMTLPDLTQMVLTRRLSPWLLLCSRKFKKFVVESATPEQQVILNNIIRPEYWAEKMEEHPDDLANIKVLVKEMGL